MRIHQLQRSKGLKDKERRRGRGNATGTGNYSGRGLKGQKSRSGFSMKPFFEGGQTSIVQRLPKARGFTRYYKLVEEVQIINLGVLDADSRIADTMEITKQLLKDLGYIKSATVVVKILGNGDYAKHLTFLDIEKFSASAKEKMEKPGKVHSVAKKTPVKVVKDPKSKVGKLKVKTLVQKNATKKTVSQANEKTAATKAAKVTVKKTVEKKPSEKADKVAPKADKPVAKKVVEKKSVEKKVVEKKPSDSAKDKPSEKAGKVAPKKDKPAKKTK